MPGRINRIVVGNVLVGVTMSVLLVAALAKFVDLRFFAASLATWTIVPAGAKPALAVAVPSAELSIALWWITGRRRSVAAMAGVALLGIFTIAYTVQAVITDPPVCNCLGKLIDYHRGMAAARAIMWRNAGLMLSAVMGIVIGWFGRDGEEQSSHARV